MSPSSLLRFSAEGTFDMHHAPSANAGECSERRWPPAGRLPCRWGRSRRGAWRRGDKPRGPEEGVRGQPPQSRRGPGTAFSSGTQQRCLWLRAPPDFRSVCSPIVPEADGAAVRERSRPARRTTARGGVHARRGTDVRPHGRPRFTRWVAGFVVTYGKARDAGPGRRRVSPRSKAPGPTAPCPVGP